MKLQAITKAIVDANPNTEEKGRLAQNLMMFADQASFSVGCVQGAEDKSLVTGEVASRLEKSWLRLNANFPRETRPHLTTAFAMPVGLDVGEQIIEEAGHFKRLSNDATNLGRETFPYLFDGASELTKEEKDALFFVLHFVFIFAFNTNQPDKLNPEYLAERKELLEEINTLTGLSDKLDLESLLEEHLRYLRGELQTSTSSVSTSDAEISYPILYAKYMSKYPPELFELADVSEGDVDGAWQYVQENYVE